MQSKDYTRMYQQHSAVCSIHDDNHLVATVHHPGNSGSQITHFRWKKTQKTPNYSFIHLFTKQTLRLIVLLSLIKGNPWEFVTHQLGKPSRPFFLHQSYVTRTYRSWPPFKVDRRKTGSWPDSIFKRKRHRDRGL